MLGLVITLLIIARIAGLLGFGGIAGTAVGFAKIIFVIAIVLFIASLIFRAGCGAVSAADYKASRSHPVGREPGTNRLDAPASAANRAMPGLLVRRHLTRDKAMALALHRVPPAKSKHIPTRPNIETRPWPPIAISPSTASCRLPAFRSHVLHQ